jgi:DNA-binding response OmpR family regulator
MNTEPQNNRVLLVEDSRSCTALVNRTLQGSANLSIVHDLKSARELLSENEFDLLLLDVGLPDGSSYELASELAFSKGNQRPRVVFLTGKKKLSDKVNGFLAGGDDYIVKPFEPLELKARVDAQLRSRSELLSHRQTLKVGNLVLDLATSSAEIHGELKKTRLDLTPTEFKILYYLARHEGRVQSREQLLAVLYDGQVHVVDRTIDVHLSRIRKKLEGCTHRLESIYGIGYRLVRTAP